MPTTNRERRYALARVRVHLMRALDSLPEPNGSVGHMRPILTSFVASINDEIGSEPEGPVRDFEYMGDGVWHETTAEPVRDHDAAIDSAAGWPDGELVMDFSREAESARLAVRLEDCGGFPGPVHTRGDC